MNLYHASKNETFMITSLPQTTLLQSMGIREFSEVHVVTRQPFGGPIVVKHKNRIIAIDKNIALNTEIRSVG